jgi:hypothetical protein
MLEQSYGQLIKPAKWSERLPDPLLDALETWTRSQAFDLKLLRWLYGGSGSHVALVRVSRDHGLVGYRILKLLPAEIADAETRNVQLAQQHSPAGFVKRHLVRTETACHLPAVDWGVHIQEVADGDLSSMRPLQEFIASPELGGRCQAIVASIVSEWNRGHDPQPADCAIAEYLGAAVRDLAEPGGGLADLVGQAGLNLARPDPEVAIPGREGMLASPLALMSGSLGADLGRVTVFLGNGHGDLHLGNVLVSAEPGARPDGYKLIDLGRFSPAAPISRDPMKLLLSVAAGWLADMRAEAAARRCLAEVTVMPQGHPATPALAGYQAIAAGIHQAARSWAVTRGMGHDWTRQNLLVLAGAALRYAGRTDLAQADRWWFFEVAALASEAMLRGDDHGRIGSPIPCGLEPQPRRASPPRAACPPAAPSLAARAFRADSPGGDEARPPARPAAPQGSQQARRNRPALVIAAALALVLAGVLIARYNLPAAASQQASRSGGAPEGGSAAPDGHAAVRTVLTMTSGDQLDLSDHLSGSAVPHDDLEFASRQNLNDQFTVVPAGVATIARSPSAPTRASCLGTLAVHHDPYVIVDTLRQNPGGAGALEIPGWICVRTEGGRIGAVEFIGAANGLPGRLRVAITNWSL